MPCQSLFHLLPKRLGVERKPGWRRNLEKLSHHGSNSTRPPIIKTLFKSTLNLQRSDYPMCLVCKLATAKARSTNVVTTKPIASKEGGLSCDQYEPGDSIATDQFIVMTPGRLQQGYGRTSAQNCFHGGTIFQDSASNLVRVQPQVSLGAGETVIGKASFED